MTRGGTAKCVSNRIFVYRMRAYLRFILYQNSHSLIEFVNKHGFGFVFVVSFVLLS